MSGMRIEQLRIAFAELNKAFETPGSPLYKDNEGLHIAMDALFLTYIDDDELHELFDEKTKWYS